MNAVLAAHETKQTTVRPAAIAAGAAILLMAVVAGAVMGLVFEKMLVADDPAATWHNLRNATTTFRFGILGWTVILVCDVVAAWGLHVVYRRKNQALSLLTAWFRLIYSALLGGAIACLLLVLGLVERPETFVGLLDSAPAADLALWLLNGFYRIWSLGLLVFGLHLLGLGVLVSERHWLHKTLSVLLLIAGVGYLLTNAANLLLADYATYKAVAEGIFMGPMILGETGLAVWLLLKGGRA
ncbi:protein of unknown function [Catalinimonas alkaloidigena]|uniref:DUF4386 domain-containing protein n=1 Tax=Catalinimonas alkaloidigena TaxID=1075417 RepID=A0A1G9KFY8_9BACT|nr:DUF4386 domain-containing protein [Catalinimonas alkaloidigena]SDL48507.1 protein of unknown function [Catalinimonas alkaloidigena]